MFSRFKPAKMVIGQNRTWIFLACVIFLASGILAYIAADQGGEPLSEILNEPYEQLQKLLKLILSSGPLVGAALIFLNNFISMAQMLLLGALLGISPLLTLGINGAVVGALAAYASSRGLPLIPLLILGILPHGVFELFAFFLCGGLGLKFGFHMVFPMQGKNRAGSYKFIWKETFTVLPLVAALLLMAALVEMLVTPALLGLILEVPF